MTTTHPSVYDIYHLGGETTVTGSCHILSIYDRTNIMVDCGLAQGSAVSTSFRNSPIPVNEIDYLFITHAHLDHIGRIPEFIESGFKGEIICSHPTKELLIPMLQDALGFSDRSEKEIQALVKKIRDFSWGFEYQKRFELKRDIFFQLKPAGHILGSCFIRFAFPGISDEEIAVIFSGDIGAEDTPLLPDPDLPDRCDLLVMESTYGDRLHQGRKERIETLSAVLQKALEDNGKVYIPAFSLGRTQELIYELDRIYDGNRASLFTQQKIPVFIDSPLGLKITGIYASLKQFWDREAKALINTGDHPIDFDGLFAVKEYRHHKELLKIDGPAIIIAGSGMCTGGRILAHFKKGLDLPENDVVFIGYQAEGTTGRKILKYAGKKDGYVHINGQQIRIKAAVHRISGYSAHADQKGLIRWVQSMPEKPCLIKLVHGDDRARKILSEKLNSIGYHIC